MKEKMTSNDLALIDALKGLFDPELTINYAEDAYTINLDLPQQLHKAAIELSSEYLEDRKHFITKDGNLLILQIDYENSSDIKPFNAKSEGADLITKERISQIEKHGYDAHHDFNFNRDDNLVLAVIGILEDSVDSYFKSDWDYSHWQKIKSKSQIEQLTVCGALIAAEIDRLIVEAELSEK